MLSDNKPPVYSGFDLAHNGYRRCAQYEGQPAAIHAEELKCHDMAIGRYVYLYLPYKDHLCVCEVEVFGVREYSGIEVFEKWHSVFSSVVPR